MDLFITNMQVFALQYITWWTGFVWITYYELLYVYILYISNTLV